jgi:hypothetical protein
MKHFLLSLFLIATIAFFEIHSVAAQDLGGGVLNPETTGGFLIGPVGGVNLVSYKTNKFAILSSEPDCFTAENGSDVCFHVGLTAEFPLGETMQNFIVGEVLYDCKSSKFTTANNTRTAIPTKLNGVVVDGSVTTNETATLNYLLANVGYKYNFTTGPSPVGPGVQLCISVGIPISAALNKTVTVTASSGSQPPNDVNTKTSTSEVPVAQDATGSSPAVATSLRIAARAQFTYDIPLTDNGSWTATPTVGYDFPFTKVDDSNRSWSASSAYGAVALRYFIGK